jgi:hypothetical protein
MPVSVFTTTHRRGEPFRLDHEDALVETDNEINLPAAEVHIDEDNRRDAMCRQDLNRAHKGSPFRCVLYRSTDENLNRSH